MKGPKYPEAELTKKIIGLAFDLFNEIGAGFPEKVYQNGLAEKLREADMNFVREKYCRIDLNGKRIGHFLVDFVVKDKVVVELKSRNELFRRDMAQVINYLKINQLKIGLILLFADKQVKIKRLIV